MVVLLGKVEEGVAGSPGSQDGYRGSGNVDLPWGAFRHED